MPVVWTVKIDEKVLSALEVNHLKKRLQAQDNSNKKRSSDVLLDSPCDVEKLLTRKRTRLDNGKIQLICFQADLLIGVKYHSMF